MDSLPPPDQYVGMNITDTLNGQEAFYTMSFDSPDNGKTYYVFAGSGKRDVTSNDTAINSNTGDTDWYYGDKFTVKRIILLTGYIPDGILEPNKATGCPVAI